jgi:hypothetical protein
MNTWYLPITILPGIGLLIISTSSLIVSLNNELERLLEEAKTNELLIQKKLSQMRLLTYSMSGFYVSTAMMVLSGPDLYLTGDSHRLFGTSGEDQADPF